MRIYDDNGLIVPNNENRDHLFLATADTAEVEGLLAPIFCFPFRASAMDFLGANSRLESLFPLVTKIELQ